MQSPNLKLQDFLDISDSDDKVTFERRLVAFAQKLDFGIVAAAVAVERPGSAPLFEMIGNTPPGFLDASRSPTAAERDPVMKRLKTTSIPFVYDQALYVRDGAGDLWEEQAPWGYRTGVSIALHLPGGVHFMLGVDREAPLPTSDTAILRLMGDLQLLAAYAQDRAVRVLIGQPAASSITLTGREREVLRWTRDGKTAWEVSRILGVAESTVNSHMRNIMEKLGVNSKHLAVTKAIGHGLL
jgi:DNA-binding CsgD family transcriptional regulator